jgi:putative oxidoreductase
MVNVDTRGHIGGYIGPCLARPAAGKGNGDFLAWAKRVWYSCGMFHLEGFLDYALVFLRIMVGLVFASSGLSHVKDPETRSKEIGMPKSFTLFLGCAELLGGIGVITGILIQLACIGLLLIMGGALQKKLFVWKTGFWGKDGFGWNYDLICSSMLIVILCADGGRFTIFG